MANNLINPEELEKSKLEVVVNHNNPQYDGTEIDLMNIFSNMNKRKGIYAWLMAFCMLLGLFVPDVGSMFGSRLNSASAVITLSYPDAEMLLAPDGTDLDMNMVMAASSVQKAMDKTDLSLDLTASQISANMHVQRMLSDDTKRQLEVVEKIDSTGSNAANYADIINRVEYTYRNQYIVTLDNGFENEYLPGDELSVLLNNIIDEFKDSFFENYAAFKLPDNHLNSLSSDSLDYVEWLDNVNDILDDLEAYCTDENKEQYLTYRSNKTGLSFADLNELITLVENVKVEYLYSFVYYNCLSKNREVTISNFNYQLRTLNRSLDLINGTIDNRKTVIENYKNDNILVSNQKNGEDQEETIVNTKRVTDYYNQLILGQAEDFGKRTDLRLTISILDDKISGFSKSAGTASQQSIADSEISQLNEIITKLYELVRNHAKEISESETYADSFASSIDSVYVREGMFSAQGLKKMGIGALIGLLAGVLIWGIDGLVAELKESSERARLAREKK